MRKLTQDQWLLKCKEKHGNRYDYSKTKYVSGRQKVIITCPTHGDFEQNAKNHSEGQGCPACNASTKITRSIFLKRAADVHGDKYDYSLVKPSGVKAKVDIVCKTHGIFKQSTQCHLQGQGCPKCKHVNLGLKQRSNNVNFIAKAKRVHGDKFDYSKVNYKRSFDFVEIICKDHGSFMQTANNHLRGQCCPECAGTRKSTTEEFIAKSISIHGETYDYSKVEYTGNKNKVTIICPTHGEFEQMPNSHLGGAGCIKCSSTGPSKAELEILELVHSVYPDAISSDRTAIAPYELDIYIPELGLAIEYNGTHWHSEKFRERKYHQNKYKQCKAKGISLFQIWEHDWLDANKRKVIMSMLSVKLGLAHRVFGRKCQVNEIDFRVAKKFYNENHLQGAGQCHSNQVHYALFNNDEILMCMSVDLNKNYLTRLCSKLNTVVVGGARKLQSMLPAGEYMTYALNDLGGKLGHYKEPSVSITEPRYFWHKSGDCIPRQRVQKHKLAALYPEYDGSTERAWMESIGYSRVFDSGNTKIIFNLD